MPDVEHIKIVATILSLIGTSILAYRVTGILNALTLVGKIQDANISQLMLPDGCSSLTYLENSIVHVEKAQKKLLLITGFAFVIISSILHALVLLLSSSQF